MPETSRLLHENEAAEILGVSPKTLANQRSRGVGLPYVKLPSGTVRYRLADLVTQIEACVVTPGGDAA